MNGEERYLLYLENQYEELQKTVERLKWEFEQKRDGMIEEIHKKMTKLKNLTPIEENDESDSDDDDESDSDESDSDESDSDESDDDKSDNNESNDDKEEESDNDTVIWKDFGKKKDSMEYQKMQNEMYLSIKNPEEWDNSGNLRVKLNRQSKEFMEIELYMKKTIAKHDGNRSTKFTTYTIQSIERIQNKQVYRDFYLKLNDMKPNENLRMLFHGASEDKVQKIISHGFDERVSSSSNMFGKGIYFAIHSSKSNQYVFTGSGCKLHQTWGCFDCDRYMLLCMVLLGKPYKTSKAMNNLVRPPEIEGDPEGRCYDSVEGLTKDEDPNAALRYKEFVVYRFNQIYPQYLIKYKLSK